MYVRYSLMTFPLTGKYSAGQMRVEESIRLAAEAKVPWVDLLNVSEEEIPEYLEALEKYPVKVKCYIGGISFLAGDDSVRERLNQELDKAVRLRAELFMIVPYSPLFDSALRSSMTADEVKKKMIEGYRMAVEMAKPYEIKVCFETTPQDESCLSGNQDCKEVLDAVPGLGLVLDTANMLPHGDTTLDAYELLKDYIIHVHLKDVALHDLDALPKREYPYEVTADGKAMIVVLHGEGCIPIREVYERMERDGYGGTYALEYAPPADAPGDFAKNLEQVKRFVAYTSEP